MSHIVDCYTGVGFRVATGEQRNKRFVTNFVTQMGDGLKSKSKSKSKKQRQKQNRLLNLKRENKRKGSKKARLQMHAWMEWVNS